MKRKLFIATVLILSGLFVVANKSYAWESPCYTPGKPTLSSPANGATGQSTSGVTLRWGDATYADVYCIYMNTYNPPATARGSTVAGVHSWYTGNWSTLQPNTTYYWRIIAFHICSGGSSASTSSDVRHFTTCAALGKATSPAPANEATSVSVTTDLGWTADACATSYDVYFGTNPTPGAGEYKGEQAGTTYEPGTMSNNATYYWRIDEKNACGTTTGDVWSFTTVQAGEIIEINSDITTNQLWTANNIYYVTDWVNIQALLVIEPGTLVIFGYGCGLFVNNGGTLISKGAPDKLIVYTCDLMYFEDNDIGYYWTYIYNGCGPYYFSPIYIEETASPSTTVTYSFIEGAVVGISTKNITLDHPIENNCLCGNIYGIGEYGTKLTDIKNNLCYMSKYSGIDVNLADVSGTGDANSHILIQNNTCDSLQHYGGITVHGVADINDAGLVMLINNIVSYSGSYYDLNTAGLNLVDGYMRYMVLNTGYCGNDKNKNWEFDEINPVEADELPYVDGPFYLDTCYLDQSCPFINAGLGYIDETPLIGMTTDITGTPDSSFVDLGFHHPNWNYSNEPNIIPTISGDPNTGWVEVGVSGYGTTTERVFVLMDGEYIDELEYFDSNMPLLLESDDYINGGHSIKVVAVDTNGLITVSGTLGANFDNTFHSIMASEYFYPTTDYNVLGFHNGSGSFEAKLTNHRDEVLWSNTYSGPCVNIVIPGAAFGNAQLCNLSITETDSGMMMAAAGGAGSGSSGGTERRLKKPFKREDCAGAKMLIITPTTDIFNSRYPAILACAKACDDRQVPWVHLYYEDVNEGNLTFLYSMSSVKFVYWAGHANSHVGEVQRTHTECWRYEPSWWHFDSQKIKAFSWTGDPEHPLPDNWDTRGFSLWSLGMHDSWKKKIVFVDGCLSAKYDDMAKAYGMYSLQGQGSLDQIYIGWRIKVLTAPPGSLFDLVLFSTDGVKMFWEQMGNGSSVGNAFWYTEQQGIGIRKTLWGPNAMMDLFDIDGDDHIFVWGNGTVKLNQIRLEP